MVVAEPYPDKSDDQTQAVAHHVASELVAFLTPLLVILDRQLDARLVRTFLHTVAAILRFRHTAHGLLLSELGAFILDGAHAPAGTKRLANLLHSPHWAASLIAEWLWQRAEAERSRLAAAGETAVVIWDQSVLEKPESQALDDLCAVRSSQAARLLRIRPGFYQPPTTQAICVAGWHWLGLLVAGGSSAPVVGAMQWWTTRGVEATDQRQVERDLLQRAAGAWGRRVRHVFDRGFAGTPWLGHLFAAEVRFVVRWPARWQLVDAQGRSRPAWQILRGQRSWGQAMIWDARRQCQRTVGVLAVPVTHPAYPARPLWLVVSRQGQGRPPWYLLTNDPQPIFAAAWATVRAYARRWQIELTWRFGKSELAMQSPRVYATETRTKLLLIVTLVYAFLLTLLTQAHETLRRTLLRLGCHRTGAHCRDVQAPLYRLRSALTHLWRTLSSSDFVSPPLNSG